MVKCANADAYSQVVQIPVDVDTYVGTERLTMAAAHQEAVIPATTQVVRLAAEGDDLRWSLSGNATATSAGFLPRGSVEFFNLAAGAFLSIYGAAGAFANLVYSKRV